MKKSNLIKLLKKITKARFVLPQKEGLQSLLILIDDVLKIPKLSHKGGKALLKALLESDGKTGTADLPLITGKIFVGLSTQAPAPEPVTTKPASDYARADFPKDAPSWGPVDYASDDVEGLFLIERENVHTGEKTYWHACEASAPTLLHWAGRGAAPRFTKTAAREHLHLLAKSSGCIYRIVSADDKPPELTAEEYKAICENKGIPYYDDAHRSPMERDGMSEQDRQHLRHDMYGDCED